MNDMKELFIQYKGILKDLLRYGVLKTEALEHTGLYNGKLGMTILFYEYSRYSGDALYEQFADEILESIMELPDDLSLDLSDGLCGIGWGITYLLRERFITGEIKDVLSDIDIKIQETIENNNSNELVLADTRLLDSQIDQALSDINTLNNIQKIQETKKKLNTYISKKARIAGENSPSGSYLRKLIDERSKYENELNNGSEYVTAPVSGMVSYRVDGLEETLTTNDFSKYNKEFLNNLNLKTGQIISTNSETGKIINNFKCYIACTSKSEEAKKAEVGDKIKITLPSTKNVDAKIEYIIKENDDEVTLVLSFSEGIDELLMYRKISFDIIWWDQSGYKVANTAIIEDNGLNYVIRTKAGYLERVLVKVKKRGEDYSIVSNYSTSEIKELENVNKNARTSIILYDELILNPKEGQINETK